FFAAWVPLTLAPVLNVAAIGPSPFGERYLYIPSLGFCLLLVWAARALVPDRRALIGVVAALLVLYSAQTMARNRDWVDTETIASRTLESSPEANWVRSFLSADYFERDKYTEAEREILTIFKYEKGAPDPKNYVSLGVIYQSRGDRSKALEMF